MPRAAGGEQAALERVDFSRHNQQQFALGFEAVPTALRIIPLQFIEAGESRRPRGLEAQHVRDRAGEMDYRELVQASRFWGLVVLSDDVLEFDGESPVLGEPAANLAVVGIEHLALILHESSGVALVLIDGFEEAGVVCRVGFEQGQAAHVVQEPCGVALVLVQPAGLGNLLAKQRARQRVAPATQQDRDVQRGGQEIPQRHRHHQALQPVQPQDGQGVEDAAHLLTASQQGGVGYPQDLRRKGRIHPNQLGHAAEHNIIGGDHPHQPDGDHG